MILECKGVPVFYTDQGSGTPIVLLHGFLENSTMWQYYSTHLSKTCRVICIDLLGHGKTACNGYIHRMEQMAIYVVDIINKLGIKNAYFAGHSMGGYVALAVAEKKPTLIRGLCLINSTFESDTPERKKNRDRAILAVKENHKRFINMSISNLFRPKNRILFSEDINHVKQEALSTPLQGIIAALQGMKIRKNRIGLLEKTKYKKLMIVSKKDPVLNYKSLLNQVKNKPIKVVVFPDGHMSPIENKKALLLELSLFVETTLITHK